MTLAQTFHHLLRVSPEPRGRPKPSRIKVSGVQRDGGGFFASAPDVFTHASTRTKMATSATEATSATVLALCSFFLLFLLFGLRSLLDLYFYRSPCTSCTVPNPSTSTYSSTNYQPADLATCLPTTYYQLTTNHELLTAKYYYECYHDNYDFSIFFTLVSP